MSSMPEEAKVYPAVIHALVEGREKLEAICRSLDSGIHTIDEFGSPCTRNLRTMVRYGVYGPTLDVVSKWLEVTA